MKNNYDPISGTSPDDRPEDDAIYAWYSGARASATLTCPTCFGAVATDIRAARGHKVWHESRGE